ncbi:ABC-2 family transporter protein [Streptococcus agalactiae]|nr:ABC-2 family transporter protein [Streptococcus agalactiae]
MFYTTDCYVKYRFLDQTIWCCYLYFYMFNDFAKYPVAIYNNLLRWIISFVIPFAFTAYYPAAYFLQDRNVYFNIGGVILISLISFMVSLILWHKGVEVYESAGS